MKSSASWRVGGGSRHPTVGLGVISPAGVQQAAVIGSAPHDHFVAGPDCRVAGAAIGRIDGTRGGPGISVGIISAAVV